MPRTVFRGIGTARKEAAAGGGGGGEESKEVGRTEGKKGTVESIMGMIGEVEDARAKFRRRGRLKFNELPVYKRVELLERDLSQRGQRYNESTMQEKKELLEGLKAVLAQQQSRRVVQRAEAKSERKRRREIASSAAEVTTLRTQLSARRSAGETEAALTALRADLRAADDRLLYAKHFPSDRRYIGLRDDDPVAAKWREALIPYIRDAVRKARLNKERVDGPLKDVPANESFYEPPPEYYLAKKNAENKAKTSPSELESKGGGVSILEVPGLNGEGTIQLDEHKKDVRMINESLIPNPASVSEITEKELQMDQQEQQKKKKKKKKKKKAVAETTPGALEAATPSTSHNPMQQPQERNAPKIGKKRKRPESAAKMLEEDDFFC